MTDFVAPPPDSEFEELFGLCGDIVAALVDDVDELPTALLSIPTMENLVSLEARYREDECAAALIDAAGRVQRHWERLNAAVGELQDAMEAYSD